MKQSTLKSFFGVSVRSEGAAKDRSGVEPIDEDDPIEDDEAVGAEGAAPVATNEIASDHAGSPAKRHIRDPESSGGVARGCTPGAEDVVVRSRSPSPTASDDGDSEGAVDAADADPGVNAYEQERAARIARNAAMLRGLNVHNLRAGIAQQARAGVRKPRAAPKKSKAPRAFGAATAAPSVRTRSRSRALTGAGAGDAARSGAPAVAAGDGAADEAKVEEVWEATAVASYDCAAAGPPSERSHPSAPTGAWRGVREVASQATGRILRKIYAAAFCDESGRLLLAGEKGMASVWAQQGKGFDFSHLQDFRLHRSWVAGAAWAGGLRCLSASNDGTLCVWDLAAAERNTGVPSQLASLVPHTGNAGKGAGIFSMDLAQPHGAADATGGGGAGAGTVVTGAKDSTVAVTKLREGGLCVDRIAETDHGVVKAVRWRDASTFASAGNDGAVCLWDARAGMDAPVASLDGVHATSINALAWRPSDGNVLASTSFDASIVVSDLRKQTPLATLTGHAHMTGRRCAAINSALLFVHSGQALLAGGFRSDAITLYDVKTAEVVSKGTVGFDPQKLVAWEGIGAVVAAGNGYLSTLLPF